MSADNEFNAAGYGTVAIPEGEKFGPYASTEVTFDCGKFKGQDGRPVTHDGVKRYVFDTVFSTGY